MIFVTVGTDHHRFDRIFNWLKEAIRRNIVASTERVVVQFGYTEGDWGGFEAHKFLPFNEMIRHFQSADLIVTHGSSTAMLAIRYGKVPLVVPRAKELGESVDNHQLEFVDETEELLPFVVARTKPEFFQALLAGKDLARVPDKRYLDERAAAVNRFRRLFVELAGRSAGERP